MNNSFTLLFILSIVIITIGIVSLLIFILKRIYKGPEKPIFSNAPNENFNKLYKTLYDKHINELEKMRKKIRPKIIGLIISSVIFFLLFIIIDSKDYSNNSIELCILFFNIIVAFYCYKSSMNDRYKYKDYYKKNIITNFIKLVNESLNVRYEKSSIDKKTFNTIYNKYIDAKFDKIIPTKFDMQKYMDGYLDNTISFSLSEISTEYTFYTANNKKNTELLFGGIFSCTNFDKNINTSIKILTNNSNVNNKLEMDYTKFEQYFDVSCEDKILATRLLTAEIMDYLLTFYTLFNIPFEIIIKNNNIYIRFYTYFKFEPTYLSVSLNKEELFIQYSILDFILNVTKKVNNILKDFEI